MQQEGSTNPVPKVNKPAIEPFHLAWYLLLMPFDM
jgi:hypothetical protein